MYYLLKTEPDEYSFGDLKNDGETKWDGVSNPVAVKHLRQMQPGDRLIVYHTGKERRAVGIATVSKTDTAKDGSPSVYIRVGEEIPNPKDLGAIKASALFRESPLVKQGRLSVVPLTEAQYKWLAGRQ